jgi:diketogulonate reductase-like aldo/keto reductase
MDTIELDFIDLYTIHWPFRNMDIVTVMETLTALRQIRRNRAIGICNLN